MKHYLNLDKWGDSYADYLYRDALSRVNSEELAESLVQETFLSGIKGSSSFQGRSNERTWLRALLKRKIIDYYRKRSSVKEFSLDQTDERFGKQGMMKYHWLDNKAPRIGR